MGYSEALEAAGAKILAFQEFGSYQGDWFALVEYKDKKGFASGSYGSCSGCDSFQAEFDYTEEQCSEHMWSADAPACADCDENKANYQKRLAEFGEGYLEELMSQEEAEKSAARNLEWDLDAKEMVDWVKAQATR